MILALGPKTAPTHSFNMPGNWELVWYRWAGNDRVLVSVGHSQMFFGDQVYVTRLVPAHPQSGALSRRVCQSCFT